MAYTDDEINTIIDKICLDISGGKSLRTALREDGMPSASTFYIWLDTYETKSKQYAHAYARRAENIFEEILEIADDGTNDYMTITKGDHEYNVEDREVTGRSKLRVDARKWMLGKMNPTKYSDKLQVDNKPFEEQPLFPDLDKPPE